MKNNVKVTAKVEPTVSAAAARNNLPVHRINSTNIYLSATITAVILNCLFSHFSRKLQRKPENMRGFNATRNVLNPNFEL